MKKMKVNRSLSKKLSKEIDAKSKECFLNALKALARQGGKGHYVEGYGIGDFPIVLAHGWVEDEDGNIIETTPSWLEMKKAQYFPAVRMTMDEAMEKLATNDTTPLVVGLEMIPVAARPAWFQAQRALYGPQYDEVAKMMGWPA